jgi:CBS domain-containing membrane protein
MKLVQDLMTRTLLTHAPEDTLQAVEKTMAEHQIRHIPVVDSDGQIAGLLSQKEFLAEAFRITDKFGAHNLQTYLAKTPISQCMKKEVATVAPDMPLAEAGKLLKEKRHACLLVSADGRHLDGMLTSRDFVRLAINLLEQ